MIAASLTTGSPQFDTPGPNPNPSIITLNYAGTTIQEALFCNLNNALTLQLPSELLVGRTDNGEGPAQSITVIDPIVLSGQQLSFDMGPVNALLAVVNATLISLQDQITALQTQEASDIAAVQAQEASDIAAVQAQITTNQTQIAANQSQIVANQAQITAILQRLTTAQPMIVSAGHPTFGAPLLTAH